MILEINSSSLRPRRAHPGDTVSHGHSFRRPSSKAHEKAESTSCSLRRHSKSVPSPHPTSACAHPATLKSAQGVQEWPSDALWLPGLSSAFATSHNPENSDDDC